MDSIDPAKQQYIIFSGVLAFIISFIYNVVFIDVFSKTLLYGFPIGLAGSEGIGNFLLKLANTIIIGLFLTPAIYFGIRWLQNRAR